MSRPCWALVLNLSETVFCGGMKVSGDHLRSDEGIAAQLRQRKRGNNGEPVVLKQE